MAATMDNFLQMMYQTVFGKQRITDCKSVDDSAAFVSTIPTKKKYSKNPWLLLPSSNPGATKSLEFYDVIKNELHMIDLPMHIVQGGGARVCGSSKGWLIIIVKETQLFLFNPLSGDQHELPSIITSVPRFYSYRETVSVFINHVELSSDDPSDPDFVVAAICGLGYVLACCRPKDKKWTVFTTKDIGVGHDRSVSCFCYISFCYQTLYVGTTSKTSSPSVITAKDYTMNLGDDSHGHEYKLKLKMLPYFNRYEQDRRPELRVSGYFGVFEGKSCENYLVESNNKNRELIFVSRFYDEVFQLKKDGCQEGEEEDDDDYDLLEALRIEEENKNYANVYQLLMKIQENTMKAKKRLMRKRYSKTSSFKVWKLIPIGENSFSLDGVESLGEDTILFLGGGSTFIHSFIHSLSDVAAADDDQKVVPVRGLGNCIFFTDYLDYRDECCPPYVSRETGVFYLEDCKIERQFPSINLVRDRDSRMYWFSPVA